MSRGLSPIGVLCGCAFILPWLTKSGGVFQPCQGSDQCPASLIFKKATVCLICREAANCRSTISRAVPPTCPACILWAYCPERFWNSAPLRAARAMFVYGYGNALSCWEKTWPAAYAAFPRATNGAGAATTAAPGRAKSKSRMKGKTDSVLPYNSSQ